MKTHKDLEFAVDDLSGHQKTFKKFNEACIFAVSLSVSDGRPHNVAVLVFSVSAAKAWDGENGVRCYKEDSEASVFQRIEISARDLGSVP